MNVMEKIITAIGSQAELARKLDVSPMVVAQWKSRNEVPAKWVLPVERVTGVSCSEIRPDLYPPDRFKGAA